MLLAIDVGNTTISIAIVKENMHRPLQRKVVFLRQLETFQEPKVLRKKLQQVLSRTMTRYAVQNVLICSVVPKIAEILKDILQKDLRIKPLVIGEDIVVPMKNCYRHPGQVGQDRLVCSYAAKRLYGEPFIVIDFGTAITFDVVSQQGEYLGGIIVPGIRLTAESLFKKTALLPKVKIKIPRELIGRDTRASILSGIFYGYGALCDGLIDAISKKLKCELKVVITGGYGHLMKKFISKEVYCVDRYLVFKGMNLLALSLK